MRGGEGGVPTGSELRGETGTSVRPWPERGQRLNTAEKPWDEARHGPLAGSSRGPWGRAWGGSPWGRVSAGPRARSSRVWRWRCLVGGSPSTPHPCVGPGSVGDSAENWLRAPRLRPGPPEPGLPLPPLRPEDPGSLLTCSRLLTGPSPHQGPRNRLTPSDPTAEPPEQPAGKGARANRVQSPRAQHSARHTLAPGNPAPDSGAFTAERWLVGNVPQVQCRGERLPPA